MVPRPTSPRLGALASRNFEHGQCSKQQNFSHALWRDQEHSNMSTQQIAARLAELCNKGEFETAQKELFANDAVSIEQNESPGFPKETKGLQSIIQKGHHWASSIEQVHGCSASKPLVAGSAIAMTLAMDVTMKERGRMKLEEVCVYEVKDGKIASERFFM
jgi:hypothetical protein